MKFILCGLMAVSMCGCLDSFSDDGAFGGATLDERGAAQELGFERGAKKANTIIDEAVALGHAEWVEEPNELGRRYARWKENGKAMGHAFDP